MPRRTGSIALPLGMRSADETKGVSSSRNGPTLGPARDFVVRRREVRRPLRRSLIANENRAKAFVGKLGEMVVCEFLTNVPSSGMSDKADQEITLEAGTHWMCSCGKSAKYPFCDGSHKGSGMGPEKLELEEATTIPVKRPSEGE